VLDEITIKVEAHVITQYKNYAHLMICLDEKMSDILIIDIDKME
jgi:hypothetical protein